MNYRALPLSCRCGERPDKIDELGLTAAHELLIRWTCAGCGGDMLVTRRLAECWRECPPPETAGSRETVFLKEDMHFLKSVGVRIVADSK